MNTLLIAAAATVIVGTGVGFAAFQYLEPEPPATDACRSLPLNERTGDGLIRFSIDNKGPPATVHLCVIDHEHNKVAMQVVNVPGHSHMDVDLRVPRGNYWAQIERGGFMARNSPHLWFCKSQAALVPIELFEHGGGISGQQCFDPSSQASLDQSVVLPARALDGPAGPAIGIGFGAAILTAFAVYYRAKLHFAALLLFTRLARPQVLQLDARARIHDLVQSQPGIHASAIADRLDLAQGEALYHLHVLVREKVLVRVGNWGLRSFFVAGRYAPQQMRAMAAVRSAALHRMLRAIQSRPGVGLAEAARVAGYSVARASRLTRRLEEVGLVERRAHGRSLIVAPRPGADALLASAS